MNKTAIFILGALTGAAGGSVATYYICKSKMEADKEAEIEDMEQYFEERYQKKLEKRQKPTIKTVPDEQPEREPSNDDEKVASNKGVKKYHHENGLESAYGSARIFGNDVKPKKEEKKKVIREISEQEFSAENGYEKQTLDVFMSYDDEEPEIVAIWAYNTDNEEFTEKRFGKTTDELLDGRTYDELCNYCDEDDGVGLLYLKNEDLHIDFECVLHKNLLDVK